MDPEKAAAGCAAPVSTIASFFMLDPATYAAGSEAGFAGLDFYVAGRGGALGDVDPDVVVAAFALFEPGMIRTNWEAGRAVMAPRDAAARFMATGHRWAVDHLAESGCDWARLADLLGRVAAGASVACAPLFAAWRTMPAPDAGADPRAAALHALNLNRELRFARHAAALVAAGISPVEALAANRPEMMPIFGWLDPAPEVTDELKARWQAAEDATNRALAADYAVLAEGERAELVSACADAAAAVS